MATPLSRGAAVSIRGCAAATSHASSAAARLWTRRRAIKWLGAKVCGVRVLQIADAFDKSAMRRSTTLAMFDGKSTHCGCILKNAREQEMQRGAPPSLLISTSATVLLSSPSCSWHRTEHISAIVMLMAIDMRHGLLSLPSRFYELPCQMPCSATSSYGSEDCKIGSSLTWRRSLRP